MSSFSYWEIEHLQAHKSVVIIGAGITGISAAISIKEKLPTTPVIVLDQYFFPRGASTKNAGFVCFGSPTELLDDLSHMSEESCVDIIKMRWEGAALLKKRLASRNYFTEDVGGYELYKSNEETTQELTKLNALMERGTQVKDYFELDQQQDFSTLAHTCVKMKSEGQINPVTMMQHLYNIAQDLGVKFLFGYRVEKLDFPSKKICCSNGQELNYDKLVLTTNAFTKHLLPQINVMPARSQVLMTEELNGLNFKGVYHFDKGYYYFRRYGNRILLGGARNKDLKAEYTDTFGNSEKIQKELIEFLESHILGHKNYKIASWWSGIMGVGPSKYPILEQLDDHVIIGVRLGGMGVAIGSLLGDKLAEKLEKIH